MRGVIIAEGLKDPALINRLAVCRTKITGEHLPVDDDGNTGRWHLYWVELDPSTIAEVQRNTRHGWYTHFWEGDRLVIVYDDAVFEATRSDRSTWWGAIAHGRSQGIPDDELDFLTDE